MNRHHLWLTPATVVIAVALAAVTAGMSLRGVDVIREWMAAPTAATPQPMYTVPGALRFKAGEYTARGQGCDSTITRPGSQIVVTDTTGASIAYAPVGEGALVDGHCVLPFTLVVPAGAGTYNVDFPQVGVNTYTEQELADLLDITFG
ncbi:hypothetical protein OG423_14130 [Micromonospora zamorensis]|uniref:hypothetical protein n=1 Tax=Micromonospora zamorensis TaxID=709883 RepID=UPI00352B278B|nr:hypothetical protein OG423_14130 [Micromonospora zamorensis]